MHNIKYTKAFLKQYKKLPTNLKNKAEIAIKKFKNNPKNPVLEAHKLNGQLEGYFAFSIDFKFRIVFELNKKSGEIFFLKVGGHEIYK